MKRENLIISILVIAALTTSCSSLGETLQGVWEGSMSTIHEVVVAPTDYIEIEEVVEAIENRDADTLKSLFSENAINDAEDFDKNIEKLFDYYQGEHTYLNKRYGLPGDLSPGYTSEAVEDGERYKLIEADYLVKTNENNYIVCIHKCSIDTAAPEEVGIYSIYVIYESMVDDEEYWEKMTPGVHVDVCSYGWDSLRK